MFVLEGNYPRCHLKDLLNMTVKFGAMLPGNRLINVHQNVTWWGKKEKKKHLFLQTTLPNPVIQLTEL